MKFINNIFGSVTELSPFGFTIRTVLVGLLLWAEGKVLPYRSGGQFAGYDFTFFWMMGGITAAPLFEPKISLINTVVIIIIIYLLHYLVSYLAVKNRTFARIVLGQSIVLIASGKLIRKNMKKGLFPLELLFSELRMADAPNIYEVEAAVLETSGHVSIIKKADAQPATPKELNLPTTPGGLPVILINDGVVQTRNLKQIGHDQAWLEQELQKNGIAQIKDIYLASIDPTGKLYYSVKNFEG